MTATGYAAIRSRADALLRKALDGGVHVAPSTAAALTLTTLFENVTPTPTGALKPLPATYHDLGYLTDKGAKFARKVTTASIKSWGLINPTRVDVTEDDESVQFACQESNVHTMALFYGVKEATISTTPHKGGAVEIDKPTVANRLTWRVAVFGADGEGTEEIDIVRFLPKAVVTTHTDQIFTNSGTTPILYGVTLQALVTDTLGYSAATFIGGPGWKSSLVSAGFTAGLTVARKSTATK